MPNLVVRQTANMHATSGPSADVLDNVLACAFEAAQAAGSLLISGRPDDGSMSIETKTSATDVVTEMDRRSEELLHRMLLTARPHDGYVGEEGADSKQTSGITWVVDPIDGTVNYLYRNPLWAVSLAACVGPDAADGRSAAVGVVHAPMLGETFWAVSGRGAFVRSDGVDRPLRVRDETRIGHALVHTGFGYESSVREFQGRAIAAVLPQVRDIRRPGSAALDMCFVAAGRCDVYFERGTHPWDRAAAALIVREAGGIVGGPHGGPESYELTIATNNHLFADVHSMLISAQAMG